MSKSPKDHLESNQTLGVQAHQAFNAADDMIQKQRIEDEQINGYAYTSNRSDDNAIHGRDLRRRVKRLPNFVCTTVCTNSGSVDDNSGQSTSSIGKISSAWPYLPPHIRDKILTLVDSFFTPECRCHNVAQPSVQASFVDRKKFETTSNQLVSRTILKALRHQPQSYGLRMDQNGWVSSSEFGHLVAQLTGIEEILSCDELQNSVRQLGLSDRVQYQDGGFRACYGHSALQFNPTQASIPTTPLYHGTSSENWRMIECFGILPSKRRFVQLTTDFDYAIDIANSKSRSPIVIQVATVAALESNVSFHPTGSHVWLSTSIPATCLHLWMDDAWIENEPTF
jgi:putative RNA 2'-phosphotransferase